MKRTLRALGLVAACAVLWFSGPARAAEGYPVQITSIAANGTTAGTCGDGVTSAAVATTTSGTVGVDISGTWTGTLVFYVREGFGGGYVSNAIATPLAGGTAVASTTANGQWNIPASGAVSVCVAFNAAAQTGTAVVQLNSSQAATGNTTLSTIATNTTGLMPSSGGSLTANIHATSTAGTQIACNSGSSPCTISNTATTILNANTSRTSCFMRAVGVVSFYCRRGTSSGNAASATAFDFILDSSGVQLVGGPDVYQCDSPGGVWQGAVNCIASASSAAVDLAVTESQ